MVILPFISYYLQHKAVISRHMITKSMCCKVMIPPHIIFPILYEDDLNVHESGKTFDTVNPSYFSAATRNI